VSSSSTDSFESTTDSLESTPTAQLIPSDENQTTHYICE